MPFIGRQPVIGNFVKLDAISVVNGQAAYTMQNGGSNFTAYNNVNQFLVSLNGILQAPTDSFTVSGSTITFASNLVTGDVIDFIIVLGNTLDVGVPSDNTVSLAKLTATGTKDATTFLRGDNTFASAGGDMTPVFYAYRNASLSFSASTWTTITFDATDVNVGSCYDTSTGRFTPTTAGKYLIQMESTVARSGSNASSAYCSISKNGTQTYKHQTLGGATHSEVTHVISAIIDMNGSTDYVDAQVYTNATSPYIVVGTNERWSSFRGFKIIE